MFRICQVRNEDIDSSYVALLQGTILVNFEKFYILKKIIPMNLDNVKELREYLENNSPKTSITVIETIYASFYIDDEDDLQTGSITREDWTPEADIDKLKKYLDKFLESIDYDADLQDFQWWCEEEYGREFEEEFIGSPDEEFQFNGEDVYLDEMRDQEEYRIIIDVGQKNW